MTTGSHVMLSATGATRSKAGLGTVLLFAGGVLLVLCAVQDAEGISGLPRFWYLNRTLWWAGALGSVVAGSWLLVPPSRVPVTSWRPSKPGVRFQRVIIYTRPGCHLCDEALTLLEEYRRWLPELESIAVDDDRQLVEKYGRCVPVVICDGKVRFRGRVSRPLLERLIEGTPPR